MHILRPRTARRLFLVGLAALAVTGARQAKPPATLEDVAWMAGTWVSTSGARTVEERWTPPAGGTMFAVSRTLNADRLVEFEYLRIVERDGGLVYVAARRATADRRPAHTARGDERDVRERGP